MVGTLGRVRSGACFIFVLVAAAFWAAAALGDATTTTTTTTASSPSYTELSPGTLPAGCLGAGGVVVEEPGQVPLSLDAPAAALGPSEYPADGSVVSFASATGDGSACRTGSVSLQSVSLFGGAVSASSVTATAGHGSVSGLEVNGSPVTATAGAPVTVGGSVRLTADGEQGRVSAVLAVRLLHASGTVPAGTVVLLGVEEAPAAPAKHVKKRTAASPRSGSSPTKSAAASHAKSSPRKAHHEQHMPQPLKVTPPLGKIHYVFPVDG